MSTEEKQSSPTSQGFDVPLHPENELEVADYIKKFYKSAEPIEIIGSGSRNI